MKQEDKTKEQKKIDSQYRQLRSKVKKSGIQSLSLEERKSFDKCKD